MRSLFVRLFVAFWITAFISGLIFAFVAYSLRPEHRGGNHAPPPNVLKDNRMPPHFDRGAPPPPPPGVPPEAPPSHLWLFMRALGVQLGIYFVVGGIICYLLAWRLTAPLRKLSEAAQKLASGDLTARTGVGREKKGDEILELSCDFDRMAERLEALVNSQKQLVRDISHELRSPLARLGVALELARRHSDSSSEPALDRIEQETSRLNGMIGELLTLSMLDGREMADDRPFLELLPLLSEVVEDCDFEAGADGRHVVLISGESVSVSGNREILRRALENVLRNAIRYTPEKGTVSVSLQSELEGVAVVRVRDKGPGVPGEALGEIFRPFYRVSEARDRQSGGAGIGLAIAAKAMEIHGGSIRASNCPDGGLEIEFRLPAHTAAD